MALGSYRPAVCAVFVNSKGLVLVCRRTDNPDVWQLPQGGIEAGETPDSALRREVGEELGITAFEVIKKGGTTTKYSWPKPNGDQVGQEIYWYLCALNPGVEPNFAQSDGTFNAEKWVELTVALDGFVAWKAKSFAAGFALLGLTP